MFSRPALLLALAGLATASFEITDPSDTVGTVAWESDNAILADYADATIMYQYITVTGPYYYDGTTETISYETLEADANDTSVLVATEGAVVNVSYTEIIKYGYSSDLLQASFFGTNAAVNVANGSSVSLDNVNITVHNGAANVYSYGSGSYVYVDGAFLYSSGPVSHGLYAGGNGTIYATNVEHYSGGNRCSSFSGDSPAGYVYVSDSVAHTDGIGSAIAYALGTVELTNVIGHASNAPALFMDANQIASFTDCDLTAGLLGGIMIFSSADRYSGASVTFTDSKLTTLGATMPALWFGNVIGTVSLTNTILNTTSGILAVANYSQVTQDFDYYADYTDNSALQSAAMTVDIASSDLTGDLVAYNGSSIVWNLTDYSTWTGTAYSGYGDAYFGISLDATSTWILTADTTVTNLTSANGTYNIESNGFNVYYTDYGNSTKRGLEVRTVPLKGGGKLMPKYLAKEFRA
ncbi:MAG: hypothetical protein M1834_008890 [Cirrosporium novae-zelandiae]|nr:MAG: hypothetical protein M1834_008890 [Cirrosporium novae-zelandiae]